MSLMRMTHTLMMYLYEVLRTPPTTKQNDALAHALHVEQMAFARTLSFGQRSGGFASKVY